MRTDQATDGQGDCFSYDRCSVCDDKSASCEASRAPVIALDERKRVYATRVAECAWEEANAPWFVWHWVRYHGYRWWG
jgi:hypothetical protein